jgi:hypothetical protein
LLSGCSGEASTTPTRGPLTTAELTWIRAESVWAIAIYDEELGPPPGAALVRECKRRLAEVGDPPTNRVSPALDRAKAACPLLATRGSLHRAESALRAADEVVLPLLRSEQDIVLTDERTRTSRADLTLSAQASQPVDEPVEVRCWSSADWRRIVGERNAWEDDSETPDELYGWADTTDNKIQMPVGECNLLRRLIRDDLLSWPRDAQVDAADSVVTFAHEIQHLVAPDADEAETECGARHTLVRTARRLGATAAEAARFAALYRSDLYPNLDSEYRSDRCAE